MAGRRDPGLHFRRANGAAADAIENSGRRCRRFGAFRRLPRVVADDERIGELAGEHLLERQFRRFAYVGPSGGRGESLPDELRYTGLINTVGATNCTRYVYPRHPPAFQTGSRSNGSWLAGSPAWSALSV